MSNQKFEGAVTGKEGSYKDRTLLLENRCEVFFHIEGEQIYVDQSPEGAEAGIWYIEQREEYAVQPAKTSTVYLKVDSHLERTASIICRVAWRYGLRHERTAFC